MLGDVPPFASGVVALPSAWLTSTFCLVVSAWLASKR
jgi:hypothetical protein